MNFQAKYVIYPVRKKCRVTILPVFPVTLDPAGEYSARLYPFSGVRRYGLRNDPAAAPGPEAEELFRACHAMKIEGGSLTLDFAFPQEDCYFFCLYLGETLVETIEFYALEDDLFRRTPYKGDNHLHTYMSDGKESPMYMAAACCRLGYDYCVITDHKLYEPSVQARDFFAPTGVDFLVIPGEEVHSPDNPAHIINMGGDASVNDWWRDHEDEYRAAVEAEMKAMPEAMTDEDRYTAAASQVMFDRIHKVDGVAVLCHPHWILAHGFNEHEDVTDYLFDHRRFDALELVAGGAFEVGVQMQLSYYQDRPKMPVLGSSDCHNTFGRRLEPGNFTVVFAEELSTPGIKDAVRGGYAVAGCKNLLYGDYRLVKYGYFLNRNFFPAHDQQRYILGAGMLRYASSLSEPDSEMGRELAEPRPSGLFGPMRYAD